MLQHSLPRTSRLRGPTVDGDGELQRPQRLMCVKVGVNAVDNMSRSALRQSAAQVMHATGDMSYGAHMGRHAARAMAYVTPKL